MSTRFGHWSLPATLLPLWEVYKFADFYLRERKYWLNFRSGFKIRKPIGGRAPLTIHALASCLLALSLFRNDALLAPPVLMHTKVSGM